MRPQGRELRGTFPAGFPRRAERETRAKSGTGSGRKPNIIHRLLPARKIRVRQAGRNRSLAATLLSRHAQYNKLKEYNQTGAAAAGATSQR